MSAVCGPHRPFPTFVARGEPKRSCSSGGSRSPQGAAAHLLGVGLPVSPERHVSRMTGQHVEVGRGALQCKGFKFLCMEPLFWQSEASLEIPWEPRAFSEGQRPSVSFATSGSGPRPILAAASERVFDAKLTLEAVRQRLLPSVRRRRLESQAAGLRALLERRRHVCGPR